MKRVFLPVLFLLALAGGAFAQSSGGCTISSACRVLSLAVTNNATIGGSLTVTGAFNFTSFSVSGNGTIGGTLAVTGGTTLTGAVTGAGMTARFASPGPIGSTLADTGAHTTLGATGQLTLNKAAGTPGSDVGFLVNAVNTYNFPAAGHDFRGRFWSSTITANSASSGIDEANFFQTIVNGTGTLSNEINTVHPYFENNGATIAAVEPFESSAFNITGTITNFASLLGIVHNGPTATLGFVSALQSGLTNDNTTAGSVNTYAALNCPGMVGSGSHPTFEYCIRNVNTAGNIATLGHVNVGTLGDLGSLLAVIGPDTSPGTIPFIVKSSASNLLLVQDDGTVTVPALINTARLTINGLDNAGGTFGFTVKNLAGTNLLLLANSGAATLTGSLSLVGATSTATVLIDTHNSTGTEIFYVLNDGSISLGTAATAKVGFYGTGPIVKATPVGACAGNTGCQAMRDAIANLGLIFPGSISN